jgi:hypothetical protein
MCRCVDGQCTGGAIWCQGNGSKRAKCLPKTYRCDAMADCSDETDEIGCGENERCHSNTILYVLHHSIITVLTISLNNWLDACRPSTLHVLNILLTIRRAL